MIFKKYSWVSFLASIIIGTTVISLFGIHYIIDKISLKELPKTKMASSINSIEALDDKLKDMKHKIPNNSMPIIKDNTQYKKDSPNMPMMPLGMDKNMKQPFNQPTNFDPKMQMPPNYPPPYGAMPPFGPPLDPAERKLIEDEMNRRRELIEQYNNQAPYAPNMDNQMPYPPMYPPAYYPDYDPENNPEEDEYYYDGEQFNDNSYYQSDYKKADSINLNEKDFYDYEER